VKELTKAELADAVTKLTEEVSALRDVFTAMRDGSNAGVSAYWIIGYAGGLGDVDAYSSGNIRLLREHARIIRRGPGCQAPAPDGTSLRCDLVTGHPGRHEMHCADDKQAVAWDAILREPPVTAGSGLLCTAATGPDEELDRSLYCDREPGHDGSHHAHAGDGSEVAWSDEPGPAEAVASCEPQRAIEASPECKCSHASGAHMGPGRSCTFSGCGCRRFRPRAVAQLTDTPAVVAGTVEHEPGPDEATTEERLLLAIYGVSPDDERNVRELRRHAAECTEDDHTHCLAALADEPAAVTR
jgi:hypothetical protein